MRLFRRKRLFVDAKVQMALLWRVAVYWSLALLTISQLLIFWKAVSGPEIAVSEHFRFENLWNEQVPVYLAFLMLLPIFLTDTAVFSNRFAGPFFRIRRAIHSLATGDPIESLQFRSNDFWNDVAKDLNALNERMEQLKKQTVLAPVLGDVGIENEFDLEPSATG